MKLFLNINEKKGVTAVELLIASSIVLVILAVVTLIYISTNRSFKFGQANLNFEADLRLAMDWLTRDIMQAENISPATVTLPISGDEFTVIMPSSICDDIIYALSSNKLQRTISGSAPKTIIGDVNEVEISVVTGDTVAITLSSTKTIFNNPHTRTLTSKVTMRN